MNYREFTERVYNYKHGLTNSAESQNIEHSAKQTEEINENEHIEHSAEGKTWDQHKYIRKEYLGNGNWRYIYEDGSSNVTNASNEKEADVKEGAYQANKSFGNGAQNTNYQTGAAKMMSSNTGFTQARKDMYKELSEQAHQRENIEKAQKTSEELGNQALRAEQDKANKATLQQAQDKITESFNNTDKNQMYQGLSNEAHKHETDLNNKATLQQAQDKMTEIAANNAKEAERREMYEGLAAQGRAKIREANRNFEPAPQAAPYQDLVNQNINATKNAQAQTLLTNYEDAIVTDVLEPLRALGIPDEAIWASIENVENEVAGEAITNSLRDVGSAKQVLFFPGAEEGLKVYRDQVLPAFQDMVAVEKLTRKDNKVNDIVASLDDEEKAIMLKALTK